MKEEKDKCAYPNGFYLIDNRISMYHLTPIELAVYNCICRHGKKNSFHLTGSPTPRASSAAGHAVKGGATE